MTILTVSNHGTVKRMPFVLALAFVVLTAWPPLASAQDGYSILPISDSGYSSTGEVPYEFLAVTADVTVPVAGDYMVWAWLDSLDGYTSIGECPIQSVTHTVRITLYCKGTDIQRSHVDGPYRLTWVLNDAWGGVLVLVVTTTQIYRAADFQAPPVTIVPPLSANGVDLNGNGLYDVLRVSFSVDAAVVGLYGVSVFVYDGTNSYTDFAFDQVAYPVGVTARQFDFSGWKISGLGISGPYFVQVTMQGEDYSILDQVVWAVDPPIDSAAFDLAPAAFSGPASVFLVDTDSDGAANLLAADVPIQVNAGGEFYLWASLCAVATGSCPTWDDADLILGPGRAVAHFEFSTIPFAALGLNGPYSIEIELDAFVDLWNYTVVGTESVSTPAYSASQFDPPPASLGSTLVGTPVDRDSDGTMDVYRVSFEMDVRESGLYRFLGSMTTDYGWNQPRSVYRFLEPGTQFVAIDFPGAEVACATLQGQCPISVSVGVAVGGTVAGFASGSYTVSPSPDVVFDAHAPAWLSGMATGASNDAPVGDLYIDAYNYETEDRVAAGSNALGAFSLPLYEGTWVLRTFDMYYRYADTLTTVQVVAPASQIDLSLPAFLPDDRTNQLTFASWGSAVQTRTWTFTGRPTTRQVDDWDYGNRDGYLDMTEFAATRHWPGTLPPPVSESSAASFLVDDQPFPLVPGSSSFAFSNVVGLVTDTSPMGGLETALYASVGTPRSDQAHTLSLQVQWALPWYTWHYSVILPGGFVASSVQAPPGIEVSGLGTGMVSLTPGPDPDPADGLTSVWVSITGAPAAPTVTDVKATPDPTVRGGPVTLSAHVGFVAGALDVTVLILDTHGKPLGTFPMVYNPVTYRYEYTATFRNQGTYTFVITATDGLGQQASATGTVVVRKGAKGASTVSDGAMWV